MKLAEGFWWLLTMCSVGWYLTVTVYVAVRGVGDIRHMLASLRQLPSSDVHEELTARKEPPT